MILSPLENSAQFILNWIQVKPVITQPFRVNRATYAQFGLRGHNGIDFRASIGTPIFAPESGMAKIANEGRQGYGLHVAIRCAWPTPLEIILGHLSSVDYAVDGNIISRGRMVGKSGNTGFSTGPHLHLGLRFLIPTEEQVIEFIKKPSKEIFDWKVKDYSNGFLGYVDPTNNLVAFKGGLLKTTIQ